MEKFWEKLLQENRVGFALLDRDLRLTQFSELFAVLASPEQQSALGQLAAECYPEIVGLEDALLKLSETPNEKLMLPCIHRASAEGGTLYLDLKFAVLPAYSNEAAKLLFTVANETEKYILQQERQQQRNEILLLRAALGAQQQFLTDSILGNSPAITRVKELVQRLAHAPFATVLLQGESGTGKSHLARVIHYLSFAAQAPFVELNCAAIPENLLEAELFGYEKGAFTNAVKSKKGLIEEADGGTLFLDEIGEMPLSLQAKLLHVLETRKFRRLGSTQEKKVQVRCIAASNRDLKAAVENKQFREDLFYRLNVVSVELPPLRELGEDVAALAEHFLKLYNLDFKKRVAGFAPEAKQLLRAYHWPGNVRELRNIIERAMIFCEASEIRERDLSLPLAVDQARASPSFDFHLPEAGIQLEEVEKSFLTQALSLAQGNKTRAASLLGLTRDTFRYRLEKYEIE